MPFDPMKYAKTPLRGEAKKRYDENWDKIDWGKEKETEKMAKDK